MGPRRTWRRRESKVHEVPPDAWNSTLCTKIIWVKESNWAEQKFSSGCSARAIRTNKVNEIHNRWIKWQIWGERMKACGKYKRVCGDVRWDMVVRAPEQMIPKSEFKGKLGTSVTVDALVFMANSVVKKRTMKNSVIGKRMTGVYGLGTIIEE